MRNSRQSRFDELAREPPLRLNDVRHDRITRVLNEVYPRLKEQLLSDRSAQNLGAALFSIICLASAEIFREVTVRKGFCA